MVSSQEESDHKPVWAVNCDPGVSKRVARYLSSANDCPQEV